METKFTKGTLKNHGLHILKEGKSGSIGQSFIMDIKHDSHGKSIPDIEGLANAKLWAAAPDLYEALEELLNSLNSYDENDIDAINKAKSALSKAIK